MNAVRNKLIVAGVVLVAAVAYLASASIKSGFVYFLEVDQFLSDSKYATQRVRLHGKVSEQAFDARSGAMEARFGLLGKTQVLPVTYRGAIPDMFQAGREVVCEGRLDPAGNFQADVLMTKCASKYQGESPHGEGSKQAKQSDGAKPLERS
jgi:cytochrome c-type biogenesis protein CcmE